MALPCSGVHTYIKPIVGLEFYHIIHCSISTDVIIHYNSSFDHGSISSIQSRQSLMKHRLDGA